MTQSAISSALRPTHYYVYTDRKQKPNTNTTRMSFLFFFFKAQFKSEHPVRTGCSPVAGVLRAWVVHLHHHEDVLEVRADVLGAEGLGSGLLEHDGDDVVPDVALPEQLQVRKHRREFRHRGGSGVLFCFVFKTPGSRLTCCLLLGV